MRNILLLAPVLVSCTATLAPPIRSVHHGAPGQLRGGQVGVGAALGNHEHGGAVASWGVSDAVAIDVGGDWGEVWRMGSVGVQLTDAALFTAGSVPMAGSAEAGLGGGLGGMLVCAKAVDPDDPNDAHDVVCAAPDGRGWRDRRAYGGYLGGGLTLMGDWFRPFVRTRLQVSKATAVPATLWWSALAGPQVLILDLVSLSLGVGAGGYTNETERDEQLLIELGVGVRIGAW